LAVARRGGSADRKGRGSLRGWRNQRMRGKRQLLGTIAWHGYRACG
jgi:hypothetical protein